MYTGLITVGVDNWRGYRFIFDTKDVRSCNNNCSTCPLYKLLKNEKAGYFSPTLYSASKVDKKMFGPQNKLNCKTLQQYKNCYISFLTEQTKTYKEIKQELKLIKNFTIIYSKGNTDLRRLEYKFRKDIMQESLRRLRGKKNNLCNRQRES